MPRQSRLVLPGFAVHVVQRGNNKQQCFFREGDYVLYLLHLRELARMHGCKVHAFCLMTNHVHLLMTPSTPEGVSVLMRNLGQRYVQYVNRTYARTGTLWEGRFRSCVAESARYVLACYRYIELNPVRAGLVSEPKNYAWSSYRANAEGADDRLSAPHPEFLALELDDASRRRAYCSLFSAVLESSMVQAIRDATSGDYPLGSASFMSGSLLPAGRRTERGQAGRPRKQLDGDSNGDLEIGL